MDCDMDVRELRTLEQNINASNHLDVISRLWNAYDRGNLNPSLSVVGRILKAAKQHSPVNPTIDDLLNEHNFSWKKV